MFLSFYLGIAAAAAAVLLAIAYLLGCGVPWWLLLAAVAGVELSLLKKVTRLTRSRSDSGRE